MAEICTACTGSSYSVQYSSPPQKGISALQLKNQVLIDGNIVNNPCYNPVSGISTWTFKFFTDFSALSPIDSVLIPICADIDKSSVAVEEKTDSTSRFIIIPFILDQNYMGFENPPAGFNWLIIENKNRFEKGAYVEYRISIEGNYPESIQPIKVIAGHNNIAFQNQDGGFKIPGCIIPDKLELETRCEVQIQNNDAVLLYNARIQNGGMTTIKDVQYQDIMNYDGVNINLSPVVLPYEPLLQITSSVPNAIIISGTLPAISPNESVSIDFSVPVISFSQPGKYIFTNLTTSSSDSANVSDTCSAYVDAVRLTANKYMSCESNNQISSYTTLTSIGMSPATNVSLTEQMTIPDEVTIRFKDYSECTVTYQNGSNVPLNTDITDTAINITCKNLLVPSAGGVRIPIVFTVTSTRAFKSPATISAVLQNVSGINSNQVYIMTQNVQSSSSINISGSVTAHE